MFKIASALNPPLAPPNKNTRPISPPKHKILEPPLFLGQVFCIIPLLRLCQQGYICIFANKTILIEPHPARVTRLHHRWGAPEAEIFFFKFLPWPRFKPRTLQSNGRERYHWTTATPCLY